MARTSTDTRTTGDAGVGVTSPAGAPSAPASYEAAMQELERLVASMEDAALPLDRLLEGYRRAGDLIGYCRGKLDAVEEQVKVLEDGQLKPWNPDA
jgi:exodeoxyribonuclease VII small subunit